MKFDLEEMESSEAQWYMGLTNVEDNVGSVKDLAPGRITQRYESPQILRKITRSKGMASGPSQPNKKKSKIASIETIPDGLESDDFVSYEKPDRDASDSEEDPTLIQRSKAYAPV